jgi:hypothetical protein
MMNKEFHGNLVPQHSDYRIKQCYKGALTKADTEQTVRLKATQSGLNH